MKKKVFATILILAITFTVIILSKEKIIANEKANIVDTKYIEYQYDTNYHTGILYDNNRLYLWGENISNKTSENVQSKDMNT